MAWNDVIEPLSVELILSSISLISAAILAGYPFSINNSFKSVAISAFACINLYILSIKISTSCPFSSLKYSAILSPVLTDLLLDTGLSPIWPYTIVILSSKLELFISSYSSLPSRLLSPAPTKTALEFELA